MVVGVQDFHNRRLHFLQIGLGTFGTFLQNLTDANESYVPIKWLLQASSNNSKSILGVGVEPVPEHVRKLVPALNELPNSCLVQAAIGAPGAGDGGSSACGGGRARKPDRMPVYTLTADKYAAYLSAVAKERRAEFESDVLYLRNMSCVGRAHPEFWKFREAIEEKYGVRLELEPVEAPCLTYGELSERLHFSGVEVLLIDAEGFDVRIIESMLDHCRKAGIDSWPDIIQFESMGHCDKIDGRGSEEAVLQSLEGAGYLIAATGKDTQAIFEKAIRRDPRVQKFLSTYKCRTCGVQGWRGMPYCCISLGEFCTACSSQSWDKWGAAAPREAPESRWAGQGAWH